MQLIRGLNNYPASRSGCVATIGNFDGVHKGHSAIFARLETLAKEQGLPRCAITFEPLPHEFFRPGSPVARLSTLRDKATAIASCGIERLLILRFNNELAGQQAEAFIQKALIKTIGVRHLVVGDDFHFGNQRRGNFQMLQEAGRANGFGVESFDTVVSKSAGNRISSSAIREALADNNFEVAEHLIGRPYTITGRVIKGQQLARQLGYPTANVCLKDFRPAIRGVFAVTASINDPAMRDKPTGIGLPGSDPAPLKGVANLGMRPTVNGTRLLLEFHAFDAEPDLYGKLLSVHFHHHLRGEKKFDSLDQLKQAIASDTAAAREYFKAQA